MLVGSGWNPFDRPAIGTARFFRGVETIEALGFESIWLPDTATGPGAAQLPALAAAAMRTTTLKLGTGVVVAPPRAAAVVAKELAAVDVISGGRLLPAFGMGVLGRPAETAAFGRDWWNERNERLDEAIAVVRRLWTGEPVTFHGRFATLDEVKLEPAPVRREIELWLSGSSPAALRRAGRLGDGWLGSFVSADAFPRQRDAIRSAAAEAGRALDDDRFGVVLWAIPTAEDRDRVVRVMPQAYLGNLQRPDEIIGVGSAGVRSMLERFRDAGVGRVVLNSASDDFEGFLRELMSEAIAPVTSRRPAS